MTHSMAARNQASIGGGSSGWVELTVYTPRTEGPEEGEGGRAENVCELVGVIDRPD